MHGHQLTHYETLHTEIEDRAVHLTLYRDSSGKVVYIDLTDLMSIAGPGLLLDGSITQRCEPSPPRAQVLKCQILKRDFNASCDSDGQHVFVPIVRTKYKGAARAFS